MTNDELDLALRQALLESLQLEQQSAPSDMLFSASTEYKRQMKKMLHNPHRWARIKAMRTRKYVLQRVAVILLIFITALAGTLMLIPDARAAVTRWLSKWNESHVTFKYTEPNSLAELAAYTITGLPETFSETERSSSEQLVSVQYQNDTGDIIYFSYIYMHDGASTDIHIDASEISSVAVGNLTGFFFRSLQPDSLNTITWIDSENQLQFVIDASLDISEMTALAVSVEKNKK